MKINAIIESKDGGTLVLDFPRSIYDVYEKLQSVGIRQSPHQITLSDEEGDDVRVKLYSEDEIGKHLLLTLKEHNSLADANMLAFMVDNAKPDFRSKLEQNLLNDQYSSMQEVTDDIKQMLYESGPVKAVFYCPLVGEVTDEEGFSSPVDGRFLKSIAELNAKLVMLEQLRSKGYLAIEVYQSQTRDIQKQISSLKSERRSAFESTIQTMLDEVLKMRSLLNEIEEPLEEFNDKLFHELVKGIEINKQDEMTVTFLGGLKFTELI